MKLDIHIDHNHKDIGGFYVQTQYASLNIPLMMLHVHIDHKDILFYNLHNDYEIIEFP